MTGPVVAKYVIGDAGTWTVLGAAAILTFWVTAASKNLAYRVVCRNKGHWTKKISYFKWNTKVSKYGKVVWQCLEIQHQFGSRQYILNLN